MRKIPTYLFKFIVFSLLWFALSGHTEVFFLVNGVLSIFATMLVQHAIEGKQPTYPHKPNILVKLKYLMWLFAQIYLSSIYTVKKIWSVTPQIEPCFHNFNHSLVQDFNISILTNSITLTPGTVSAATDKKIILVHVIDSSLISGIDEMRDKVAKL